MAVDGHETVVVFDGMFGLDAAGSPWGEVRSMDETRGHHPHEGMLVKGRGHGDFA